MHCLYKNVHFTHNLFHELPEFAEGTKVTYTFDNSHIGGDIDVLSTIHTIVLDNSFCCGDVHFREDSDSNEPHAVILQNGGRLLGAVHNGNLINLN